MLQSEEIAKIYAARESSYETVCKAVYDKDGVSTEQFEFSYFYLSDETSYSDYGTDTYRLAKEVKAFGRIVKLDTISPLMLQKHDLYSHLANAPASHRFPKALGHSSLLKETIGVSKKYGYKSCVISSLSSVSITLKHENLSCFASEHKDVMYDGLPSIINREFGIISEKDYGDIRVLFLLAPAS